MSWEGVFLVVLSEGGEILKLCDMRKLSFDEREEGNQKSWTSHPNHTDVPIVGSQGAQ